MQLAEAHSSIQWYEQRIAELESSDAEAQLRQHQGEIAALRKQHAAELASVRAQLLQQDATPGAHGKPQDEQPAQSGDAHTRAHQSAAARRYDDAPGDALSSLLYGGDDSESNSVADEPVRPTPQQQAPAQALDEPSPSPQVPSHSPPPAAHEAASAGEQVQPAEHTLLQSCAQCAAMAHSVSALAAHHDIALPAECDAWQLGSSAESGAAATAAAAAAQAISAAITELHNALHDERMRVQALLYTLEGTARDQSRPCADTKPGKELSAAVSALQKECSQQQAELHALQQQLAAAQQQEHSAGVELRSQQEQLAQTTSAHAELQQHSAATEQELADAKARLAALQHEHDALQKAHDPGAQQHASALAVELAELRTAHDALKTQHDPGATAKIERVTAELSALQEVNAKLLDKVAALQRRLQDGSVVPLTEARAAVARAKEVAEAQLQVCTPCVFGPHVQCFSGRSGARFCVAATSEQSGLAATMRHSSTLLVCRHHRVASGNVCANCRNAMASGGSALQSCANSWRTTTASLMMRRSPSWPAFAPSALCSHTHSMLGSRAPQQMRSRAMAMSTATLCTKTPGPAQLAQRAWPSCWSKLSRSLCLRALSVLRAAQRRSCRHTCRSRSCNARRAHARLHKAQQTARSSSSRSNGSNSSRMMALQKPVVKRRMAKPQRRGLWL